MMKYPLYLLQSISPSSTTLTKQLYKFLLEVHLPEYVNIMTLNVVDWIIRLQLDVFLRSSLISDCYVGLDEVSWPLDINTAGKVEIGKYLNLRSSILPIAKMPL